MSKKVIIIGPPKEAKETLEVLIDNKIEAEIYTEYPKSILSSLKELDLELDDMIKETKYEKLATIAEPFSS